MTKTRITVIFIVFSILFLGLNYLHYSKTIFKEKKLEKLDYFYNFESLLRNYYLDYAIHEESFADYLEALCEFTEVESKKKLFCGYTTLNINVQLTNDSMIVYIGDEYLNLKKQRLREKSFFDFLKYSIKRQQYASLLFKAPITSIFCNGKNNIYIKTVAIRNVDGSDTQITEGIYEIMYGILGPDKFKLTPIEELELNRNARHLITYTNKKCTIFNCDANNSKSLPQREINALKENIKVYLEEMKVESAIFYTSFYMY